MAGELQFIYESTGADLYFALRNLSSQMWNTSGTPDWEARTVANWSDYAISMSETPADSYLYLGTIPAIAGNMDAGWMWADIYEQAGETPDIDDDTLVGQMLGYWDGTTFRIHEGGLDADDISAEAVTKMILANHLAKTLTVLTTKIRDIPAGKVGPKVSMLPKGTCRLPTEADS